MTEQDLQQIRQLIREEVEGLRLEFATAHEGLRTEFVQRLDRAVEAVTTNISDVRTEILARFESVDRRLERIETNVAAIQLQTMGMSKSLTDAERIDSRILAIQSEQQKSVGDLYAKLADLERRIQASRQ
jgi:hypothetical protein